MEDDEEAGPKPLEGETIVLSGTFERIDWNRMEEFLRGLGARVTGSVSGKTTWLVVGSKLEDGWEIHQGSKYQKAKSLGTPILTEDEVEKWIKEQIGNENFTLENYKNWNNKEASAVPKIEKARPTTSSQIKGQEQ